MSDLIDNEYDIPTAVTFLLAGIGIGSLVTILLTPRAPARGSGIHRVSPRIISPKVASNSDLRRAL
jgi:hypothetical protein